MELVLIKTKIFKTFLVLLIFFVFPLTQAQQTLITYEPVVPPVFPEQSTPIILGILDFNSSTADSNYAEKFYFALKSDTSLLRKFMIYPFSSLQQIKKTLKIESFAPSDSDLQKKLYDNLGIEYLVSGKVTNKELTLFITNTDSGKLVFSNFYRDTDSSSALKDALKLFSTGVTTKYQRRGILNVSITPAGAEFKIDTIPQKNRTNIILDPGKYIIEFTKEGYYQLKESIEIIEGKTLNKEYKLCRAFGGAKITVSPTDVRTKIIREEDTTITKEETGDISINNLQAGMYRFIFSRIGYIISDLKFRINPGEILEEKVSLIKSFIVLEDISSNNVRVYGLKVEPGEDFYKIKYNLAGKPDENFDIYINIVSKSNPDKLIKRITELKGDWGRKVKVGTNKTIIWDVKKEFRNGFGTNDYLIFLEVD